MMLVGAVRFSPYGVYVWHAECDADLATLGHHAIKGYNPNKI